MASKRGRRGSRSSGATPTAVDRMAGAGRWAVPVLVVAGLVLVGGWLLHAVASSAASVFDVELAEVSAGWRLGVFGIFDVVAIVLAVGWLDRLASAIGRWTRAGFKRLGRRPPANPLRGVRIPLPVRAVVGATTTLLALPLVVGLLLQPTLVPMRLDGASWLARAANLADGSASTAVVDAAVWVVRWFHAEPVEVEQTVGPDAFGIDLDADVVPLIDRWDDQLLAAAEGDRERFARTKAVMWVESGGRQFALSSTGCAGLMQFCATTAQEPPLHAIFGTGQVAACGCADCGVARELQIALETDPTVAATSPEAFPCSLTDARFDADKAIRAGVAWIDKLDGQLGGNLPLVYVAYNSGPSIARRLHGALGPDVTIEGLRPHLANALGPVYGDRANGRAQGLLDVHLPKLMQAYEKWR